MAEYNSFNEDEMIRLLEEERKEMTIKKELRIVISMVLIFFVVFAATSLIYLDLKVALFTGALTTVCFSLIVLLSDTIVAIYCKILKMIDAIADSYGLNSIEVLLTRSILLTMVLAGCAGLIKQGIIGFFIGFFGSLVICLTICFPILIFSSPIEELAD